MSSKIYDDDIPSPPFSSSCTYEEDNFRSIPSNLVIDNHFYNVYEEDVYRSVTAFDHVVPFPSNTFNNNHNNNNDVDFFNSAVAKNLSKAILSHCISEDFSMDEDHCIDDFSYLCSSGTDSLASSCDSLLSLERESINIPKLSLDTLISDDCIDNNLVSETFVPNSKEHLKTPMMPAFPFSLERGKHFDLNGDIKQVISAIEQALLAVSATSMFDARNSRWDVKTCDESLSMDIRVFRRNFNTNEHIVEVKRQSGCCIGFSNLYRDLHEIISQAWV